MIVHLSDAEKKRASPEGIKKLIGYTEEKLKNPYRNDKKELQEELDYYKDLLKEVKEK